MKKITIITIAFLFCSTVMFAQGSSSASQTAQLSLSDALDITFTGTGTATGNAVNMNFNTPNDYANGVTSSAQEMKVRSNKNFKVSVKFDVNSFSYTGTGNLNLANIPPDAFKLMVTSNATGGSVNSPFSTTVYAPVYASDQDVIINGSKGSNQKFAVQYKCTPGWNMPAGTYTIDLVYTATQQ